MNVHATPETAASERTLRQNLAATFRWAVREDWHEAVANHFSAVMEDGSGRFLINANQIHFSRVTASNLLAIDPTDPATYTGPDAPDPTAWGLHGAIHAACPHARVAMHVHSKYATVLASLADSRLPAIDQTSAMFFDRVAIDESYGGLAFEEEGARCAELLADPKKTVLMMGNHGILVIGRTVAEAFTRLYYFERAAQTVVLAYMTGRPLRTLSDEIAAKTADEIENYPGQGVRHLEEVRLLLDRDEPDYAA